MGINYILPIDEKTNANISFFGIYEGHGGDTTAEILKNNLHKNIIENKIFLSEPEKSIINGFGKIEEMALDKKQLLDDLSGSSAIVLLTISKK